MSPFTGHTLTLGEHLKRLWQEKNLFCFSKKYKCVSQHSVWICSTDIVMGALKTSLSEHLMEQWNSSDQGFNQWCTALNPVKMSLLPCLHPGIEVLLNSAISKQYTIAFLFNEKSEMTLPPCSPPKTCSSTIIQLFLFQLVTHPHKQPGHRETQRMCKASPEAKQPTAAVKIRNETGKNILYSSDLIWTFR